MYCFFRPLDEGSEAKKTSSSRGLLTTPSRFQKTNGSGWNSADCDAICFTGMRKENYLFILICTSMMGFSSVTGISSCMT